MSCLVNGLRSKQEILKSHMNEKVFGEGKVGDYIEYFCFEGYVIDGPC